MSNQMIAGYHDLYWAEAGSSVTVTLGSTGPNGIQYIETPHVDWITGDVLGPESVVDGVYQGKSAVISFMLQEIKLTAAKKFLFPFQATTGNTGANPENFGLPGTIMSISYAGTLEAIPRTGTPAAALHASGGNGRRFVGLFAGEVRESLDTTKRFIPVVFRCFPFDVAGTLKMYKRIATQNEA